MSKFRLVRDKNLVRIAKKYWRGVPVNQRELDIFEKNLVTGFFRPQLRGKKEIVYTAPMGKPLAEYKKDLTVHKLYGILAQLVEVAKKIDSYGFYMNNLILDERLIYVREITGELIFLYEPVICRENSTNFFAFLPDWVNRIKSDDQNVQKECKKIEIFLADPANYRMEDVENFIVTAYPQIYQQIIRAETGKRNISRKPVVQEDSGTVLLKEAEEKGTTLLGAEEGTMLLSRTETVAKLCRMRSGDVVMLYGREFHIGKDRGCEYCISDNMAVSRNHAVILHRGTEYVIRDEHSTNHSYVNGTMLQSGEERELHDGDIIRLADEEFTFYTE